MKTLPERTNPNKQKNQPPIIPGGVYMIPPLAAVSVWAALKLKLINWRDLCVWIALWEVRTWRDTKDPAQRNIFRFSPARVSRALGGKRTGSRLKKALGDLKRLGLARLNPTEISFTKSLDELPPELRAETERMLKVLGNDNFYRALRMPRRLMHHMMKSSRPRPVRAAVIFGMLLRTMMIKRDGWYKGCLTTAILADASGFNKSRIKHERAVLVREGFFERLETPARVRQQHGDWYALGYNLPMPSKLQNDADRQPPQPSNGADRQPPITKPAPSVGIERNQLRASKAAASLSSEIAKPTAAPSWHRMTTGDFREPQRRAALYEDACRHAAIGHSRAGKLMFYAAIARARRLATINPCGMLRRIVETTSYGRYIANCDEDQARAWLSAEESPDLGTADARHHLRRFLEPPACHQPLGQADDDAPTLILPELPTVEQAGDSVIARYLTRRLQQAGLPTHDAFNLIMTTHEGRERLSGWTQERWNEASNARLLPLPARKRGVTTLLPLQESRKVLENSDSNLIAMLRGDHSRLDSVSTKGQQPESSGP